MNGSLTRPFPGLAPFSVEYADYFVGRTRESGVVADNLLARSVSVLYGPSGAGKTSLINAGLPRQLDRRSRWPHTPIVCAWWADGASAGLRRALAGFLQTTSEQSLDDLLAQGLAALEGRLLLVLDQFEEHYTSHDALDRDFVQAIASAGPRVKLLVSMREDGLDLLDRMDRDIPGVFENLIQIKPLSSVAGREAIVEPLTIWNRAAEEPVEPDDDLVEEILKGIVVNGTSESPTVRTSELQLVMARLWELREHSPDGTGKLRLDTLLKLGGVKGIVAAHIDSMLEGYSVRDREAIDAMFERLITPTGAKVPLSAADLARHAGIDEEKAGRIAAGLTRGAKLLEPLGDSRFQLSHDALAAPISSWRRRWADRRAKRLAWRRLAAVMAFVAVLLIIATETGLLRPLELATLDARFSIRGALPPPRDLVLVKIDYASLERLKHEWPLPRALEGKAIESIGNGSPRVIAYDVDFSGDNPENESLALTIGESANHIVLAAEAVGPGGNVALLGGSAGLAELGARAGYSAFPFDDRGVIRHPLYAFEGLQSFAVATVEVATHKRVSPRGLERSWIDYYGPEGALRSVPFWEVVEHRVPSSFFRDKIVVVGVTLPAIDRHPVWGTHNTDMSGAEVQANAIQTIRRGLPLRSSPAWLSVMLTLGFALLPLLPRRRLASVYVSLALALLIASVYVVLAQVAFDHGTVLPLVAPLTALLLAAFALMLLAGVPRDEPARLPPRSL
jgi:CHASE2 domain-containing sensor protein